MVQSPFWICWLFQMKRADWRSLSTESQHTQINTCIGTAIMTFHPNTVWLGLCSTELKPSALDQLNCRKKRSTYITPWKNVSTQHGPSIGWNQTPAPKKKNNNRNSNPNNSREQKPHITVPYHQGLSEDFKRTCKKYDIEVYLKGGPTIRNLLMTPKDKDPILKRSGVIYRFKCNRVECDEEYIGESARNFGERFKEHQKAPSPIHDHINISGHTVSIEDFSILAREDQNLLGTIKEAMYIRANNPPLNRNVGKFHLSHIWDEVLLNISELKLKWSWPVVIPSATMAITSAKQKPTLGGCLIYHHGNNICQHYIQTNCGFPSTTYNGNNICHLTI